MTTRTTILRTLAILLAVAAWFAAAHLLDRGAGVQMSADLDHRRDLPAIPTDPNGMPNQERTDARSGNDAGREATGK